MVEINESQRKKEKRIKRNEDNLRDLWDNVKRPNIRIIGVPEEDKKKDHEKILEEIIGETSLNREGNNHPTPRNPDSPKQNKPKVKHPSSVQFSSVAQSCLTLCDPMNRSTPGLRFECWGV